MLPTAMDLCGGCRYLQPADRDHEGECDHGSSPMAPFYDATKLPVAVFTRNGEEQGCLPRAVGKRIEIEG